MDDDNDGVDDDFEPSQTRRPRRRRDRDAYRDVSPLRRSNDTGTFDDNDVVPSVRNAGRGSYNVAPVPGTGYFGTGGGRGGSNGGGRAPDMTPQGPEQVTPPSMGPGDKNVTLATEGPDDAPLVKKSGESDLDFTTRQATLDQVQADRRKLKQERDAILRRRQAGETQEGDEDIITTLTEQRRIRKEEEAAIRRGEMIEPKPLSPVPEQELKEPKQDVAHIYMTSVWDY